MSWGHLGATGATLGPPEPLGVYQDHLGTTLGTPWGHEVHLRATTATSDTPQGHLRDSLEMSWGHFGDMGATLGQGSWWNWPSRCHLGMCQPAVTP